MHFEIGMKADEDIPRISCSQDPGMAQHQVNGCEDFLP